MSAKLLLVTVVAGMYCAGAADALRISFVGDAALTYAHGSNLQLLRRSGSMEPAFYKGDILFLNNDPSPMEVGEIIVFKVDGKDVPIVHRIIESNSLANSTAVYMTKGDNNPMDDRQGGLYADGQMWLQRHHMLGRAVGALPFVGHVTILLNEYPLAKVLIVGLMGLLVMSSREG